ncbi:MAG: hypothetical protein HYR74_04745 [Candidatus Eisenbacteria bacterium]|nr:hypothetical protein [Candidatus Eisenbacteria bacterium]
MNAELARFVHEALARGLSRDAIRSQLIAAGWRADEIEAALRSWTETGFPIPVPRRRPSLNAREAFLYLVLFAALYTSAFDTGQVLFGIIQRAFPDPVRVPYDSGPWGQWIRSALAGLIIAFPVYLSFSRLIGRQVEREPERAGSPVRKWLTYLTLFVAALVIIGDLIVLVNCALEGQLVTPLALKILVVLSIAGSVFGHYLGGLRRDERGAAGATGGMRLGARLAAAGVIVVMIAGMVAAGSPIKERWRQLDAQRVQALSQIVTAIQLHESNAGTLPAILPEVLDNPHGGFDRSLIEDPESHLPYGYQRIDSLTYRLCADFRTASDPAPMQPRESEFWRHGAGHKCFTIMVERMGGWRR